MEKKDKRVEELLNQITEVRFTEPDIVLKNALELYQISQRKKDLHLASVAKFFEGDAYLSLGELNQACPPLLEASQIQQAHGYTDYLGKCYNVLGAVFYSQSDYVLAMRYLMKALDLAYETKDELTQTYINNNVAAVFLVYQDYKHAHAFFQKAADGAKKYLKEDSLQNQYAGARMNLNLGICLNSEKKYQEAKVLLEEVLSQASTEELDNMCVYVWEFAASLYYNLEEYDKAIGYALRMVKDAEEKLCPEDINCTLICIQILTEQGYYEEAKKLIGIVDCVAVKTGSCLNEIIAIKEWIGFYQKMGDEEQCHHYYKRYFDAVLRSKMQDEASQVVAVENRELLASMMDKEKSLLIANDQIEEISYRDGLTGLLNRKGMKQFAEEIWNRNKKGNSFCHLAIIDLDHFKEYNDRYGHITGDQCLQKIGEHIQNIENECIKGVRFGGDEFFVVGEQMETEKFIATIEHLLQSIRTIQIAIDGEQMITVTGSIGIFSMIPVGNLDFHECIHHADQALYQAKKKGRDCYVVYQEE